MLLWALTSIAKYRTRARQAVMFWLVLLIVIAPLNSAETRCKWSGIKNIVAIADIHGDFKNFIAILNGIGLVDDNLDWTGGQTHLVQLGDVMDRGDHARDALDLLKKLEKQAEDSGGMVHVLLGNHEEANIVTVVFDTPGYVTLKQFLDFLPEKYKAKKENAERKKFLMEGNPNGSFPEHLKLFWASELNNAREYDSESRKAYSLFFYDNYGKWLLTKNIAIKINDILFTHGGISAEFIMANNRNWDLETLNRKARSEFRALHEAVINKDQALLSRIEIIFTLQPNSPQWFREFVRGPEENLQSNLDRTLNFLKANHMVVGHTVRAKPFISQKKLDRFDQKLWGIDVGMSDYYNGILCALIIEDGKFRVWWGDDES